MSNLFIRPAIEDDAEELAELLNEIIRIGGTTAYQSVMDKGDIIRDFVRSKWLLSCFVAEMEGKVVGFQHLDAADPEYSGPFKLGAGWSVIASFVRVDHHGQGIGRRLFQKTKTAAKQAGSFAIDATIRADNTLGLAFYQNLGFRTYVTIEDVPLSDGTRVDRARKKYDLTVEE